MDISEGVNRMANDNITASATPWARQCLEDLGALAAISEDFGDWFQGRQSDLSLFRPGSAEWKRFTTTDPTILRSAAYYWSQVDGGDGEEEVGEVDKDY
eukprot:2916037-Pyramimonas_sp.AAC.1